MISRWTHSILAAKKKRGGLKDTAFPAPMRQIPSLYRLESRLSARRCTKQGHRLKMLICITHCPLTEGIMPNKGRCLRGDYWDYCYFPLIHTARFICFFLKFLTIGGFCFAGRLIAKLSVSYIICINSMHIFGNVTMQIDFKWGAKTYEATDQNSCEQTNQCCPFFSRGCNSWRLSIAELQ